MIAQCKHPAGATIPSGSGWKCLDCGKESPSFSADLISELQSANAILEGYKVEADRECERLRGFINEGEYASIRKLQAANAECERLRAEVVWRDKQAAAASALIEKLRTERETAEARHRAVMDAVKDHERDYYNDGFTAFICAIKAALNQQEEGVARRD